MKDIFLHAQKGLKHLKRDGRQKGYTAKRDGINIEHHVVIVIIVRQGKKDMNVSNIGKNTRVHVQKDLEEKVTKRSVF